MSKKAEVFNDAENVSGFDSEEAHFFHTLASFEDLIREYGVDEALVHIDPEIYQELFDFFVPIEGEEEYEDD